MLAALGRNTPAHTNDRDHSHRGDPAEQEQECADVHPRHSAPAIPAAHKAKRSANRRAGWSTRYKGGSSSRRSRRHQQGRPDIQASLSAARRGLFTKRSASGHGGGLLRPPSGVLAGRPHRGSNCGPLRPGSPMVSRLAARPPRRRAAFLRIPPEGWDWDDAPLPHPPVPCPACLLGGPAIPLAVPSTGWQQEHAHDQDSDGYACDPGSHSVGHMLPPVKSRSHHLSSPSPSRSSTMPPRPNLNPLMRIGRDARLLQSFSDVPTWFGNVHDLAVREAFGWRRSQQHHPIGRRGSARRRADRAWT